MKNLQHLLVTLAVAALASCGSSAKTGKTGSNLKSGVKGQTSALMSKKPMDAAKVTTPPKAIPMARVGTDDTTGEMEEVAPPSPMEMAETKGGDETWTVSADDDIDLDGDGDGDAATVLYDDESSTLFVWFTASTDLDGDGTEDTYDAFFWISGDAVGFIITVGNDAAACTADATGTTGCVYCTAGDCHPEGTEDDVDSEETLEDDEMHEGE